jgi:hypothetical protein
MMNNELQATHESEELEGGEMGDVTAESVDIAQGGARNVKGTHVTLRQAGAQSVQADNVVIRQGGVVRAQADHLEMLQGGIVLAQTKTANLTASHAGVVIAGGQVRMEQAGAKTLLSGGDVTMDQSGAVVMAARNVTAKNCNTVLLIAPQVEGTVHTAFGPRESVIFGVVAGAVTGLVLSLFRLVRRR